MTIRRADIPDCNEILRLLGQIAAHHRKGRPDLMGNCRSKLDRTELAAILRDEQQPVFVAQDGNGAVCGYAFCRVLDTKNHPVLNDRRALYIDDFCVDETRRHQGVGKLLFQRCEEEAVARGCDDIELNVWEFNKNAIAFYQSCGMKTQRRQMEMKVKY